MLAGFADAVISSLDFGPSLFNILDKYFETAWRFSTKVLHGSQLGSVVTQYKDFVTCATKRASLFVRTIPVLWKK